MTRAYGKEKIVILETSDVHGNILPINYGNNAAAPLGMAKLSSYIKEIKNKEKNTFIIDNGDIIQGTPLTYHFVKQMEDKPNPLIHVLNYLEYDAAVIGNHEFNYGLDVLKSAVSEANFPFLSANILHHATKETYFGTPYVIKKYQSGIKVAVLGVTTHYIPNWENPAHIKGLYFEDAIQSTKRWVQYIRETEKPDVLVVSYHGGFERDIDTGELIEKDMGENQAYRMCMEIDGIDVLLTGHQHRLLSSQLNGVIIVQPGYNGQAIAEVQLELQYEDEQWIITRKEGRIITAELLETDCAIVELTSSYEDETQNWLDQPIGTIEGNMEIYDSFLARLEEHPAIEFINIVQMNAANVDISNTALFNNNAKGFPNDVTMRDIVSNYIYPNTLRVLRITGKDLRSALERSASYFIVNQHGEIDINPEFITPKPQHYNYDMWEGINYTIHVDRPIGKRIEDVFYKGKAIHDDDEYEVVMNNYRAGGGGEYTMFKGKPVVKEIQIDMSELIANYFLEHKVVQATTNNNWKIVYK